MGVRDDGVDAYKGKGINGDGMGSKTEMVASLKLLV